MYFDYRGRGFASVTSAKLRGERGIGTLVLGVELTVMMQPASAARASSTARAPFIVALQGCLSIDGTLLAPLETECVNWHCVDYAQPNNLVLRAFLSGEQIRTVDLLRSADGGFDLHVALTAQVDGGEGLIPVPYPLGVPVPVTGSDWTRILKEMQYEDRATFEVPVEGGRVGPPLDKAAAYMRAALDKVQQRQWDDALTKCREVLTELQSFAPTSPPPPISDWSDRGKRDSWSLLERVTALLGTVRHVTHAGPHAAIGTASEHEVRLVVTLTAAFLRYSASR